MKPIKVSGDSVISGVIKICGYSSILFVTLILLFLLREGLPALWNVPLSSLVSTIWYPIEGYFGLLPLIGGSLLVTISATLIALPFGIGTALYLSEMAPRWMKEVLKPVVEILAGFLRWCLVSSAFLCSFHSCARLSTCPLD